MAQGDNPGPPGTSGGVEEAGVTRPSPGSGPPREGGHRGGSRACCTGEGVAVEEGFQQRCREGKRGDDQPSSDIVPYHQGDGAQGDLPLLSGSSKSPSWLMNPNVLSLTFLLPHFPPSNLLCTQQGNELCDSKGKSCCVPHPLPQ